MSTSAYPTDNEGIWARSDAYHNSHLIANRIPALDSALSESNAAGLPEIAVSAAQGKFLNLLIRSHGWKRVLEVGTLGGYSTIWLAEAIPADGKIVTLELSDKHAEVRPLRALHLIFDIDCALSQVARKNIANAGHASKVEVIVGPALDSLPTLGPNPPFDLAFIDADKESNTEYFHHAKRLVRPGGVIIVDNVGRQGSVANESNTDSRVEGVRRLLRYIKDDKAVDATTIHTVGDKGFDGFLYAIRL